MRIEETLIPGCYQLLPQVRTDERGRFVKTFHKDTFAAYGLVTGFAEEYYSVSHKGVLRGMHFQTPPHEHFKLVYCLAGSALDAIIDLRSGSPTHKQAATIELSAELGNMLYIAPGVAHGFYALSNDVVMQYKVTSMYAPDNDTGIRWDSAGIAWPDAAPLVSARDAAFPRLDEFESPFIYSDKAGGARQ